MYRPEILAQSVLLRHHFFIFSSFLQLANAFGAIGSDGQLRTPFAEALRRSPEWVAALERRLAVLVALPATKLRVHVCAPMPTEQRAAIHEVRI